MTEAIADATAETETAPPPLPGLGTEEGEILRRAHRAFEAGDFAQLRRLCASIAEAEDVEVARAAKALDARLKPDPVQIAILLGCLLFFLFVALKYT